MKVGIRMTESITSQRLEELLCEALYKETFLVNSLKESVFEIEEIEDGIGSQVINVTFKPSTINDFTHLKQNKGKIRNAINDILLSFGTRISLRTCEILLSTTKQKKTISIKGDYDSLKELAKKTETVHAIEQMYIIEACDCASINKFLAATTMLGCAAEHFIFNFSKAYLSYIKNHGTPTEIINAEKMVNANKASVRLNYFINIAESKKSLFEQLGIENPKLHLDGFFDIIRQLRNDSGHPTGNVVEKEMVDILFTRYAFILVKVHPLLKKLPLV
ncbi:hypothetical protein ACDZ29_25605 [Peribacillus sp. RS7]|uniref:hypothetical protein n=1 Tax=Peribacillus sp. RS7 TaxID=3242679 RepID=UPI0035C173A8